MLFELKEELYSYYLHGDDERSRQFAEMCFEAMNDRFVDGMSVTEQKLLQYDVICELFEPKIFKALPFYYEMGVVTSLSDGSRTAKGYNFTQANGWVYERNRHLFIDQDKALYEKRYNQALEKLYNICGAYNDVTQHFNLNYRPFLEMGARGIYERARGELANAKTDEEREFLEAVMSSMLLLKRIALKFYRCARDLLLTEENEEYRANLRIITETAPRIPWEAPRTLFEALELLLFMRSACGALEGIGINTFGRIDRDLIGFYEKDIRDGVITREGAYDLVKRHMSTRMHALHARKPLRGFFSGSMSA